MTMMMFLAAVASTFTPEIPVPQGFEPLTASAESSPLCTADKVWCISMSEGAPLVVTKNGKDVGSWTPDDKDSAPQLTVMPGLLRLADGSALVGVEASRSLMFSGGGGSIEEQRLIHVQPSKASAVVLAVPSHTDMIIRACFSEKDMEQRAGACHDDYQLDGELAVVGVGKDVVPDLILMVAAKSFPRGVSRDADSLAIPPLKKRDLVWETDATCTYQRTFRFNAASGEYVPDAPLPDCSQYTDE